ncbi:MAG: hypothetical protein J6Y96_00740 [Mycoplasma sp.]|nr:hypothetical protein [Mycoplasma sp.]
MNNTKNTKNYKTSKSENLDKLADLYNEGIKNKKKSSYSLLFNGIVIILSSISAVCLGIMICHLIYIYC